MAARDVQDEQNAMPSPDEDEVSAPAPGGRIRAAVTAPSPAPAVTVIATVTNTELCPDTTAIQDRSLTVITIQGGASATSTIASLSSALAAAQASVSVLAQENQALEVASLSAVASAQAAAQSSASLLAASISSSAAAALSSVSALVASANSAASAAMQSANAAVASTSVLQAQAELRSQQNRFSEAQLIIAIVVSIIGTLLAALAGFWCVLRHRERREKRRLRELRAAIKRPRTASSTGSGAMTWDEAVRAMPGGSRRQEREPSRFATPPRGPPKAPAPRVPGTGTSTIRDDRAATTDWPRGAPRTQSNVKLARDPSRWAAASSPPPNTAGPWLSLFPRVPEPDASGANLLSPRQNPRRVE